MQLSLRYFINKNIRNLLVVFVIMIFITGAYILCILPTITNITFAPYELDYLSAFEPKNLVMIPRNSDLTHPKKDLFSAVNDAKNGKVNEEQFYQMLLDSLRKHEGINVEAQSLYNYTNVYMQNNKYKFSIKPVGAYDLGLSYKTAYKISVGGIKSSPTEPVISHKYILLDTGNAYVLTKVAPDF